MDKFIGMFIGQEVEANEKFAAIEKRYNELKELAANVKKRPVVFSGEIRGGNWYAVGGKSFLAELFRDAGADYFLKDDPRSGGVTLDLKPYIARRRVPTIGALSTAMTGRSRMMP